MQPLFLSLHYNSEVLFYNLPSLKMISANHWPDYCREVSRVHDRCHNFRNGSNKLTLIDFPNRTKFWKITYKKQWSKFYRPSNEKTVEPTKQANTYLFLGFFYRNVFVVSSESFKWRRGNKDNIRHEFRGFQNLEGLQGLVVKFSNKEQIKWVCEAKERPCTQTVRAAVINL